MGTKVGAVISTELLATHMYKTLEKSCRQPANRYHEQEITLHHCRSLKIGSHLLGLQNSAWVDWHTDFLHCARTRMNAEVAEDFLALYNWKANWRLSLEGGVQCKGIELGNCIRLLDNSKHVCLLNKWHHRSYECLKTSSSEARKGFSSQECRLLSEVGSAVPTPHWVTCNLSFMKPKNFFWTLWPWTHIHTETCTHTH